MWYKDKSNEIRSFMKDENRFLSNMYELTNPIEIAHIKFYSAETAYQACKYDSIEMKQSIAKMNPYYSKKFVREQLNSGVLILSEEFKKNKLRFMYTCCKQKFMNNHDLKELLLNTGSKKLIEGNTWNDTFWGVNCKTGLGNNNLGIILMNIRNEILFEDLL